jgi:hypothetical protein
MDENRQTLIKYRLEMAEELNIPDLNEVKELLEDTKFFIQEIEDYLERGKNV